jgi:hypothetical protein
MNPFKRNFLQHAHAVGGWMRTHGATGGMDVITLQMQISLGSKSLRFFPQFTANDAHGEMAFFPDILDGVNGFVGWYPYQGKAWPAAQTKLAFKQLAAQSKLRTPPWTQDLSQVKGAFIIKADRSSLGRGLRGPFHVPAGSAAPSILQLAPDEYAEQFVLGRLVKAWFWNQQLAVAELTPMPYVQGDGHSTVDQLLARKLTDGQRVPEPLDSLLALQTLQRHSVLRKDQAAVVDYRYMSPLNPAITQDHNVQPHIQGSKLEAQLLQAGQCFWDDMPADLREGTISSADAVMDAQGRLWFLELNCNPLLHPAFYSTMLDGIFGVKTPANSTAHNTPTKATSP